MTKKHSINLDRLVKDMDFINDITATPGHGSTRFSYSHEDQQVREYILKEIENLEMEAKIDGVGNIRAKYNPTNSDAPSIMIGSHIDTVPNGGRYDGLAGTISALEVIRTIAENKVEINKPIELIIFAEEEGSNFGSTTFGSKVLTGRLSKEEVKNASDSQGVSAYDVMKDFGLDVESIGENLLTADEVEAMIEIHIEQGNVLEKENKSVGIVTAISGMNTFTVTLNGVSNHAGTTPMIGRRDPLVGAAKIILAMEEFARTKVHETTVATVGKLHCFPAGSNVINNEVVFNVDIRDVNQKGIDKTSDYLKEIVAEVAKEHELEHSIKLVGSSKSVDLSEKVINALEENVKTREIPYKIMHSGAVHDAMMLTDLTDVGMLFVPSKDGISHNPEEYTSFEDIELGANVLLDTVITLAE